MMPVDKYAVKAITLSPSQFPEVLSVILHYQLRIAVSMQYLCSI